MLTVTLPANFSVIQRNDDNVACVKVSGNLKTDAREVIIEARTVLEDGRMGASTDWVEICRCSGEGVFSGELVVPAGGWYRLDVQAASDGKVIDKFSVERFGVGEVFITAGQSNSANHGESPQKPWDDRVAAYHIGAWRQACDPQPGATGEGGTPWPILGSMLAENLQMPIGFASVGVGGSSLAEWLESPGYYKQLVRAACALGAFRAILWHQGESDAICHTSKQDYVDGVTRLIRMSASESGVDAPWVVAEASFIKEDPRFEHEIAEAQRELWKRGVALRGPCTNDMIGSSFRYDEIHFTNMGLRVHAQRWFAFLWTHFFAGKI